MAATQGYLLPGLRGESVSRSAMFLLVLGGGSVSMQGPPGDLRTSGSPQLKDCWMALHGTSPICEVVES